MIGLPVEWHDFYVTNAVVVVLGLVQAALAPSLPLAPLVFAALMLINATFFHLLPMLRTGGRYSPGVATAVVLFYPAGLAVFASALAGGQAGIGLMASAFAIGAALMAFPIILMKIRAHPYFRQS